MRILLLLLASCVAHADDTPFYLKALSSQRDISAINENFRSAADSVRKTDLTNGGTVSGDLTATRICFPDGTCQSTAATSLYDATITTFTTRIPNATGTNTTFAGCISSTSITTNFLVAKSTAMAVLSISARKSDAGNYLEPTITMDGIKSLSNDTATDLYIVQSVAGADMLIHETTLWINVSTGPHTFCYGMGQNAAGTWNIEGGIGIFMAGPKR